VRKAAPPETLGKPKTVKVVQDLSKPKRKPGRPKRVDQNFWSTLAEVVRVQHELAVYDELIHHLDAFLNPDIGRPKTLIVRNVPMASVVEQGTIMDVRGTLLKHATKLRNQIRAPERPNVIDD